ncbi:MAG TPA: hypothetical protein VII39_15410 [Bradyrhizobium sp.]|jgi:hypothetical protein
MQFTTEASDNLVCVLLAAQVAELRDRIDGGATVELLWRTSDVLSQLSGLVLALAKRCNDSELNEQCDAAVAAEAEISRSLESLAFEQAQRNDFTCQTVDCVVTALERLADTDGPTANRLSPDDLAALYVSEEQRKVHDAATRRFAMVAASGPNGTENPRRQGPGE